MTAYSVVEAKNRLPRLIDEAISGAPVVITRHGKPVAELRATHHPDPKAAKAAHQWLRSRRAGRRAIPITSVELLRQIYEEE